jgi:four helix bundle protein
MRAPGFAWHWRMQDRGARRSVAGGGVTAHRARPSAGAKGLDAMLDTHLLPHHKLYAFKVATQLLVAVREAHVRDAHLRDQAIRAAQSCCLNTAEGAARVTRADKARAFTIARAEAVEAAAALEIAVLSGVASEEHSRRVNALVHSLVGMLTRLIR